MPELPEVETIVRDIRRHVAGVRIVRVRVFKADILRNATRERFARALAGRRVTSVTRRAKNVVLALDDGRRVVIQPGMTGALLVDEWTSGRADELVRGGDRYDALRFGLENSRLLRYRDVRRLGRVYLFTPAQWARHDAAIGPEPLDPSFTAERFHVILRGVRAAVKKAIMDQKRLAGVGNIYASEALWMSGIDPSREARTITADEVARLHAAVVEVLASSIRGRGTTVRDYRTGTGQPGTFQGRLAVYDRQGEPCLRCGRRIVMTHAIDARSSYFCPGCQR
jgi:formamidopyrimidine-DNA glycosylase